MINDIEDNETVVFLDRQTTDSTKRMTTLGNQSYDSNRSGSMMILRKKAEQDNLYQSILGPNLMKTFKEEEIAHVHRMFKS